MSKSTHTMLHELVERFGTYSAIPPEAWAAYDAAVREYRARLQRRRSQERAAS